ncbi:MAG: rod shape-determining protein RodA [Endomicrobium sp.]|jgi:rod shape determining protein RodA|nr:rod shape-determining protein RodA [Endomicrobium sp.]
MNKKFLHYIDYKLIAPVICLIAIGFVSLYSACIKYGSSLKFIFIQIISCILGSLICYFLAKFNYIFYKKYYLFIYFVSIILLGLVLIFGSFKRGTKGWFNFGLFSFQPVEIAKIMFILAISSFLDNNILHINRIRCLSTIMMFLAGHLILIMLQPDFSSTLSYFPIIMILLFIVDIKRFYLLCIFILGIISLGIPLLKTFSEMYLLHYHKDMFLTHTANANVRLIFIFICFILAISIWFILKQIKIKVSIKYIVILLFIVILGNICSLPIEHSLKNYQKKRFIVFLNPQIDPYGFGYNIIQSKIAIGSGKLFGKGFKNGSQTQLGFLPEQHTDFIFSLIGEEGGWILAQLTIIIYLFFILRSLSIAKEAKDRYGSLVAIGITTMFMFYAIINIGMTMGLMPVTGMPLLFISYGGSSMVSSLCAVGILCSIASKKYSYY